MKRLRLLASLIFLLAAGHSLAQVTTLDCDGIARLLEENVSFCEPSEQAALAKADQRLADLESIYPGWTVFYAVVDVVSSQTTTCVIVNFYRCIVGAAYPGIDHYKTASPQTASPLQSSITPLLDLGYQISRVDNFKDGRTRVHLTDAFGKTFLITIGKTGALAGITQEQE